MQQRLQGGHQRICDDDGTLRGGMNSIVLDGSWNVDELFVDHGHECRVMFRGKRFVNLVELLDVVRAVVWGERNAREQYLDVRGLERGDHFIKIVPCLFDWQAAQSVVASEFDDYDTRVKTKD